MKKFLFVYLCFASMTWIYAQDFADSVGTTGERAKTVATYLTAYADRFPVSMGISGVAFDTAVTIGVTPIRLSDSIGTFRLTLLYLYNNTAASTIWISTSSNPVSNGIPITYDTSWLDAIGFFNTTREVWVATTSGTANARVKIKYKNVF